MKAIQQALAEDEDVLALDAGNSERAGKREPGILAITDRRVIWASKILGTGGLRDFRHDRIATVDAEKPSMLSKGHTLKLETAGGDLTVKMLRKDYGAMIRERM